MSFKLSLCACLLGPPYLLRPVRTQRGRPHVRSVSTRIFPNAAPCFVLAESRAPHDAKSGVPCPGCGARGRMNRSLVV